MEDGQWFEFVLGDVKMIGNAIELHVSYISNDMWLSFVFKGIHLWKTLFILIFLANSY